LVGADRGFALLAASVAVLFVTSFAFAAIALIFRLRNAWVERRRRQLFDRWEPIALEVLGGAAPDSALLRMVETREVSVFLSFLMGYARRLKGDEGAIVRRLARPYLPALAATVRRGGPETRGLAVHRLAEIGMPDYAVVVAGALEDRSSAVALIAARGLFRRGQERFFPAVLAQLPRFAHLSRSFLASLLSQGGSGAAPLLRGILADPSTPAVVRAVGVDSLRLLNDLDALPLAAELLRTSSDRELVTACLKLVRQLGHHDHLPLVRALVRSPDPLIRATAAGALGAIGGPNDVPLLQEALDDELYWVSLQAARGLMALGEIETLRRLAASNGPWAVLARQVLSE
jgi:HEAT repeat protein